MHLAQLSPIISKNIKTDKLRKFATNSDSMREIARINLREKEIKGRNLPANAGDTGSSPGLGRSHMPWSN